MKFCALTFLALSSSAAAFSTSLPRATNAQSSTGLFATNDANSRRNFILATGSSSLAFLLSRTEAANAESSLLEQFGSDPSKIAEKKAAVSAASPQAKSESTIEPNLRSNYYYPTNKKRYLPRIKKCNDAIPEAADAIGDGDWDIAENFVNKIADDTILPLKLYTSSLTGGGTNVKVSFTKDMSNAASEFEKAQKALAKAVQKKDKQASSKALETMSLALQNYREAGRLTGPDAGGDIPSVDEIRRSACRVQGRSFEQKVRARDARLAEAQKRDEALAKAGIPTQ